MKSILKKTSKIIGVTTIIKRIFAYFLQQTIKEKPYLLEELQDELTRHQRSKLLHKIKTKGNNVVINGGIKVTEPRSLILGNNVHIGDSCYFFTRAGLTIGDNCHLSRNITIYTSSHDYTGDVVPYSSDHIDKPVTIAPNVWIGMNVNILPGITIGEGAIIGMGTTVARDIAAGEIVGSQPHRVIKQRDMEQYKSSVQQKRFGGINGKLLNEQTINNYTVGLNHPQSQPFFVLSTGRSGSTTIAKLLSQHSDVTCLHEPKFSLIRLSTEYLHGKKTKTQVQQELASLYLESHCHPIGIYGESDQKLSNMVTLLAELIPNAKFIWLIRKPDDVVNSTSSRGWFSDEELRFSNNEKCDNPLYRGIFSDYRPQADKAGMLKSSEWRVMSAFERNCWYWHFWNNMIKQQLAPLAPERWLKVRLEELDQHHEQILGFIGANQSNLNPLVANTAEKRYSLTTNDDWTTEMKAQFEHWCIESRLY